MRLPAIRDVNSQKVYTVGFGGLNLTDTAGENEFTAMNNMSSDRFPSLSVRDGRRLIEKDCGITCMAASEKLITVSGGSVYRDRRKVDGLELTDGEKFIVCSDSRAYIFPDKKWVDTSDEGGFGSMEHTAVHSSGALVIEPALREFGGAEYVQSETEPEVSSPAEFEGRFWLDNGSIPCKLKKYVYDGTSGSFTEVTPDCTRIIIADSQGHAVPDFFDGFDIGDGVTLSATASMGNTLSALGLSGDFVLIGKGEGYALIDKKVPSYRVCLIGLLPDSGSFTVRRRVPDLDMAVFAGGRIFGCNIAENRIYASRKDDLCSWYGSSSSTDDPFRINAGTPSPFTAAAVYMGVPVFFKEDCIHKIVGLSHTALRCEGVRSGCGKSVCLVAGALYYRSRDHVCCYDGSVPCVVSARLGKLPVISAYAAAVGDKYYISQKDPSGTVRTLVFDCSRKLWHEEDLIKFRCSALYGGVLYAVTEDGDLLSIGGDDGSPEKELVWFAESGDIRTKRGGKKLLSRLTVRCELPPGSSASVYVMYEENGDYIFAGSLSDGCTSLPLRRRRSDRIRIRIEGRGPFTLLSLVRTFTEAGEH